MLCSAGPAQAAVYKGIWDPTYGGPFPNLGWKGEAFFDVPVSCISQAAGWYGNTGVCSGLQVLSGTLSFYDASTDPQGLSPLETFTLNPSVTVYEVYTNSTALKGVSTGFFAPVVPSGAAMSIAGGGSYYFDLKFLKELSPAGTPSVQLFNTFGLHDPACLSDGPLCIGGASSNKAIVVFSPVPEPEAYALMLAGLGVVGFAARRRAVRGG